MNIILRKMLRTIVSYLSFYVVAVRTQDYTTALGPAVIDCFNENGQPQVCQPGFENAAFNKLMEATSTCGENGPAEYCTQTASPSQRYCDVCKPGEFSARHLTDLHANTSTTQSYWQSAPILAKNSQNPESVNLTLHLGKAYDITYIQIYFQSPKPRSFAIYKKRCEKCEWEPYQYYSATCRDFYGVPETTVARLGNEAKPLCTSEYSDISPLIGGSVPFATIQGRPSAPNFYKSQELHDWVTATDIKITLDRLNTFGDEIYGDGQVLKSYWYAIADVAIGARCKCNGHASKCESIIDSKGETRKVCRCQHNTAGVDCEKCLDFYNDAPWGRATNINPHVCKECNCNGYSQTCVFDNTLYEKTGHGGRCTNCTHNRDGPNCESCKENYYQREDGLCIECSCHEIGSRTLHCNSEGKCQCKPGVTGEKCDRCAPNFYDLNTSGCKPCGCEAAGSTNNYPTCDVVSGHCQCKVNVEGRRCRECKPGFFNLDMENEFGCTPCFCYGHSSECSSAPDYSKVTLESQFVRNNEKWSAVDEFNQPRPVKFNTKTQDIYIDAENLEHLVYFSAPERFLGDQRGAYNHEMSFTLRTSSDIVQPLSADIILEGGGNSVTMRIFGQNNEEPNSKPKEFKYKLHEHPKYQWTPTLPTMNYMSILANLTAIKIRASYGRGSHASLSNFKLVSAQRGVAGYSAKWIEMCQCLDAYVGQFCESCAPGFRHSPALGGPFMMCIPCNCNGHANICDSETGRCICEHNTSGDNCELCAKGFYGNAMSGTESDCQPCPCPNQSACIQMMDQSITCTDCPAGYVGKKCELCSDGYYGDPSGRNGDPKPCVPCDCNLNVDLNAVGNCNRTTGQCLKCIYNTAGNNCERCLNGFYGDALAPVKGDCQACECYPPGTVEAEDGIPQCNAVTGQCSCRNHVTGHNCDKCDVGFFDIISENGCRACNCNLEGSFNRSCDVLTGQCFCKPGVTGLHCDMCRRYTFGFSSEGCTECQCDERGSTGAQCDNSGQCPCLENVEGRKCERCKENKQSRLDLGGCKDCPACYDLVQNVVNQHRADLLELEQTLEKISKDPTVVESTEFDNKLEKVRRELDDLSLQAEETSGIEFLGGSVTDSFRNLNNSLRNIEEQLENVTFSIQQTEDDFVDAESMIFETTNLSKKAREELNSALDGLDTRAAEALDGVRTRLDQFGQHLRAPMVQYAQESRNIVDQLELEANNLKEKSFLANETARAASSLAKQGIKKQYNISEELKELSSDLKLANDDLKTLEERSRQTLRQSDFIYGSSLDILNSINSLYVPVINTSDLLTKATAITEQATKIKDDIESLKKESQPLLSDLAKQTTNGRVLLSQAVEKEQTIQNLLATLDAIHDQAQKAVSQTNDTLQRANKINDTLKTDEQIKKRSFDTRAEGIKLQDEVIKLRGRVEETAGKIDGLDTQINESKQRTHNANEKVGQAWNDAKELKKLVQAVNIQLLTINEELQTLPALDDNALLNLEIKLQAAERDLQDADFDGKIKLLSDTKREHQNWINNYQNEANSLEDQVRNVESILKELPPIDQCYDAISIESPVDITE